VAKVVATDAGDLLRPAIETMHAAGEEIDVFPDGLTAEEAAERAADAQVLLIGLLHMRRPAIEKLRSVGLMIRCGIGVDVIDVDFATERGIWVANVPDYCVEEVADQAMLLMLGAARQYRHFEQSWREGRWAALEYPPVRRLSGQTLGIVGLGRIGTQVAQRARASGSMSSRAIPTCPRSGSPPPAPSGSSCPSCSRAATSSRSTCRSPPRPATSSAPTNSGR
jgi:D-3-phosphoglycerate dehydrogenase